MTSIQRPRIPRLRPRHLLRFAVTSFALMDDPDSLLIILNLSVWIAAAPRRRTPVKRKRKTFGQQIIASLADFKTVVDRDEPIEQHVVRRMKVKGKTVHVHDTFRSPLGPIAKSR